MKYKLRKIQGGTDKFTISVVVSAHSSCLLMVVCVCVCVSHSVISNPFEPHGL